MNDAEQFTERRRKGEWHLDKTVSVTHIFSTVAAIATLVVLGAQFNTRLSLVEQAVVIQHGSEERQDKEHETYKTEMRAIVTSINAKLDRLIERQFK